MIDLHCHLLPGIDDGPPHVDGSLAIARRALREGIQTMVATPHVNSRYRNDEGTIAAALETVRAALAHEQVPLEVLPGAEIGVNYLAETDAPGIGRLSLGGGEWLLIEPPFATVASGLVSTVQGLLWSGKRVVLAHPERCPAIQRDVSIVRLLADEGVLMSLTAGSLGGRFGSQARRLAVALLEEGLAHNVTSDAHDADNRPPSIAREIEQAGFADLTAWLTEDVPAAVLAGGPVPPRPRRAARSGVRSRVARAIRRAW
jgi:protein-tyrosine phosphatase